MGDFEHGLLGALDEVARGVAVLADLGLDPVRGGEQAAQQRVLADDLRVAARAADRWRSGREGVDRRGAAGLVEPAALAKVVGDGDHVDRLVLVVEREHRFVDEPVALAVEVLALEPLLDDQRVQRAVQVPVRLAGKNIDKCHSSVRSQRAPRLA